jgi:hypothetical protein
MDIKQFSDYGGTISNRRLALRLPSRSFRFGWLAVGLVTGYVISRFDLSSIGLLALLAAFAGISANWSS